MKYRLYIYLKKYYNIIRLKCQEKVEKQNKLIYFVAFYDVLINIIIIIK